MIIYLISIFLLIILSGFFSGSETGIIASSKGKIYRLSQDGSKSAKNVEKLLKNKEGLMATILLGNNIVNILASALTTSLFIEYFGSAGVFYATIIMTVLLLIFSEITPKTYALKNSEKVALFCSWPLLLFTKIFYPVTIILNKIVGLLTDSSFKKKDEFNISDFDEIKGTIALKHKEGSIVKYDKDMISGILDLNSVTIADVVVHRKNIQSININQNIDKIIKQALKINHTKIPLFNGDRDNIVSILDVRKLIKSLHKNHNDFTKIKISSITSKPWFIPITNNLRDQLAIFKKKEKNFAIVIDEYGMLIGIITLEDILEEIVGNISEKEIRKKTKIIKLKDDYYQIPGEFPIRDINRKLNWQLPENDDRFSTLAGYIIEKLQRIPNQKEKFDFDSFSIVISKKEQNKIILLKVKKNKLEE